jgi:hypothetical protein
MKQLSFLHGWHSARLRLGKWWPGFALLGALSLVFAAGMVEGQSIAGASAARAAEAVLVQGVTFGLLLPLLCFALDIRLDTSLSALMSALWVRHGAERRAFALGRLTLPIALSSGIVLAGGSLALGLSSALSDPALALPVGLATSWLGVLGAALLGAASYVAGLGWAQLAGGAWGRALFLVADWLLGAGSGVAALPWPRAHLRHLLGGESVAGLSTPLSALWLGAIALGYLFFYLRRVPH